MFFPVDEPTPRGKSIALIEFTDNGFVVNEEAVDILNQLQAPVAVVAVAGLYRTGKSFLLNKVVLRQPAFTVGPTTRACTKGIWMWSRPLLVDGVNVLVIDTEGIGAPTADASHDTRIFALGLLLSSYFIYNSVGSIDEQALNNISLVTNLSLALQGDKEVFAPPGFLWVVRDFALQMRDESGGTIGAREYLEDALRPTATAAKNKIRDCLRDYFPDRDCFTLVRPCTNESQLQNLDSLPDRALRPEFVAQAAELNTKIFEEAVRRPMRVNGQNISGAMIAMLCASYVTAVNEGRLPDIKDAWTYVCEAQRAQLEAQAVLSFTEFVTSCGSPPAIFLDEARTERDRLVASLRTNPLWKDTDTASVVTALNDVLLRVSWRYHQQYMARVREAARETTDPLAGLDAFLGIHNNNTPIDEEGVRELWRLDESALRVFYDQCARAEWWAVAWPMVRGRTGDAEVEVATLRAEMQRTRSTHETAVAALREEVDRKTDAHRELKSYFDMELSERCTLVAALETKLEEATAAFIKLSSEGSASTAALEQELCRERLRADGATAEVARLREEVGELTVDSAVVVEQTRALSEVTLERDRLRVEVAEFRRELTEQKRTLATVETSFKKESKEMQEKMMQSLQAMKETRRAEQTQMRGKCALLEATERALREEVGVLRAQQAESLAVHEQQITTLRAQVEESETRLSANLKDVSTRLSESEQLRKEKEKLAESLQGRFREERLRAEQEFTARLKEAESRAINAESVVAQQQRQIDLAEERWSRKRARTDGDASEKSLQLVKVEAELCWLRQQKTDADAQVTDMKRRNHELETTIRGLERAMDIQLTRAKLEYESRIAALEHKLSGAE